MKRPKTATLINVFCFLVLFRWAASPLSEHMNLLKAGEAAPAWMLWAGMAGVVFSAWQTDGLARLKAVNCWIAVAVFSWLAISKVLLWGAVIRGRETKPLGNMVVISLCAGAVWYLTRPEFRDFASKYSAGRDQEDLRKRMQKLSLKKISKGLWR